MCDSSVTSTVPFHPHLIELEIRVDGSIITIILLLIVFNNSRINICSTHVLLYTIFDILLFSGFLSFLHVLVIRSPILITCVVIFTFWAFVRIVSLFSQL